MAFSGGVFTRLYNWVADRDSGIKIRADRMDAELDGIATGLSTCILKDGSQAVTGNIPLAGYRLTDVGDPTAAQDAATKTWVETVLQSTFTDDVFCVVDNGDNTKKVAFEVAGVAAATTRTITIPDSNGTMLTTANAAISDAIFTVQDNADATKQLQFQCSGITTSTTRTVTWPDSDGTVVLQETLSSYINALADLGPSVDFANDYIPIRDATDGSLKKISPDEFGGSLDINGLSDDGANVAVDDMLIYYDTTAATNVKGTFQRVLGEVIEKSSTFTNLTGNEEFLLRSPFDSETAAITYGYLCISLSKQSGSQFAPTPPFASYDAALVGSGSNVRRLAFGLYECTAASSGQLGLAFSDDGGSTWTSAIAVGPTFSSTNTMFYIQIEQYKAVADHVSIVTVYGLSTGTHSDPSAGSISSVDHILVEMDNTGIDEIRFSHSGGNITGFNGYSYWG